jgi:collagenase-like PrtC family protease
MLTFSVATNWDDNLIRRIDVLDSAHKVTEIFGKLASDFVGGGRASYTLPFVSKRNASRHIKLVKDTGREFNYLLNASCLDNREFTRTGQKEIKRLLSWLGSLDVDAITVSNPYLGYLIKKEYPWFKLTVSAHALVDSVRKVKFWAEEIGVDKITLPLHGINRNFPLLEKIRSKVKCSLQLIANAPCFYDCPFNLYHISFLSHSSQSHHPLRGFGIDWCLMNCRYRLLNSPEKIIKAHWIRPEDAEHYQNAGINSLKIIDRIGDTQTIVYILKAYLDNKFEGNLLDLIIHKNKLPGKKLFLAGLRFFLHPLYINIFKLRKFSGLYSDIAIFVDNRKLDGFLDYFIEGKCKINECASCDYCQRIAEKTVSIDNALNEKHKERLRTAIGSLTAGDVFSYF